MTSHHSSVAYDVIVETTQGPGSRVTGRSSATLRDGQDDTLEITRRTFDVLHK